MTLRADINELIALSHTLHKLAAKADHLDSALSGVVDIDADFGADGLPTALLEAVRFSANLLVDELIPGIRDRLESTGLVLADAAAQYRGRDDATAAQLAATCAAALGDWTTGTTRWP